MLSRFGVVEIEFSVSYKYGNFKFVIQYKITRMDSTVTFGNPLLSDNLMI